MGRRGRCFKGRSWGVKGLGVGTVMAKDGVDVMRVVTVSEIRVRREGKRDMRCERFAGASGEEVRRAFDRVGEFV